MKTISVIILLTTFLAMAETTQPDALFASGVKFFAEQNYTEAENQFNAVLKNDPEHVDTLVNLSLVQLKLNKIGQALGYLRKAQRLAPDNKKLIQTFAYIEKTIPAKAIAAHEGLFYELHDNLLKTTSLNATLLLVAMTLLFSGIVILNFFKLRKKAILEEKPTPTFPYIGAVLLILFLLSTVLFSLKAFDLSIKRATIIVAKVEVKLGIEETDPVLFEIFEGQEVILSETRGDWSLIEVNQEQSGWIKNENFYKQF